MAKNENTELAVSNFAAIANSDFTDGDVLNICTAFEIAFGLDDTDDKETTVNEMQITEFGKSIESKRIWYLFQKAINFTSEAEKVQAINSISEFVLLRNDIVHKGVINWGDCGFFSKTLIKILYVNTLLRAGFDKDTAIDIAKTKWRD